MIRLVIAAGVAAAALLPAAAMAQPYYEPPTNYPDQQSRSADDNSRDSSDRDYDQDQDRGGDRDYDRGRGDADRGQEQGDHFTGRVGSAWMDADGRRCRWREAAARAGTDRRC